MNSTLYCTACSRGRILGLTWDKSFKSFPSCYSQSPLLKDFTPLPLNKTGLKLVCNVNIICGNLKSENSQARNPQQNCTFMNSASALPLPADWGLAYIQRKSMQRSTILLQKQHCGSGSGAAWIRIILRGRIRIHIRVKSWIRIRIKVKNLGAVEAQQEP